MVVLLGLSRSTWSNSPSSAPLPPKNHPITQRVQTILADPSSPDVPRLEAEIDELVLDLYGLTATERALVLAVSA